MSIAFALIFVNCTNAEEAAAAPSGSGDSEPEVPVLPETVKISSNCREITAPFI